MTNTLWLTLLVAFGLMLIGRLPRKCAGFLFAFYVLVILGLTLARPAGVRKIQLIPDHKDILAVPWKSHGQYIVAEWVDNILLFIPFGFLLKTTFTGIRARDALVSTIAFSVLIELIQYIFALGVCEINDIVHNVMGSAFGYIIKKACLKAKVGVNQNE